MVYVGEPVPDDDQEQAALRAAYISAGWDITIYVHDDQRVIVAERGGATVITDTARGFRAHLLMSCGVKGEISAAGIM